MVFAEYLTFMCFPSRLFYRRENMENKKPVKLCTIADCGRKHYASGFCNKHYMRVRLYGDPNHNADPKARGEKRKENNQKRFVLKDRKVCSVCKEEKDLSEFYPDKRNLDGRGPMCRSCGKIGRKERQAEYYQRKKEIVKQKTKEYYEQNKESILKEQREKRQENLEEFRTRDKERYQRRVQNGLNEALKQKYRNDPVYRQKHIDCWKGWKEKRPEDFDAIYSRRSAVKRKAQLDSFDDSGHFRHLIDWQQGHCYYCNQPTQNAHKDHIVPINRNGQILGTHSAKNLVYTCSKCNLSKNNKLLWKEWKPETVFVDEIFSYQDENVGILSSFFLSERNRQDAKTIVSGIRTKYPDLLLFWDSQWDRKKDLIQNMVRAKKQGFSSIPARKTTVFEIDPETAKEFQEKTHIQGFRNSSLFLGLVRENELLGCASFTFFETHVELVRLSFSGHVVGGFGKLISAFRKLYPEKTLMSYVDPMYGTGNSYLKVGFQEKNQTGVPSYFYATPDGVRNRTIYMKHKLNNVLDYSDLSITEIENTRINGLYRIFSLPQKIFVLGTERKDLEEDLTEDGTLDGNPSS